MTGRPDAGPGAGEGETRTPPRITKDQVRRAATHLRDFAVSARLVGGARRATGPAWIADEHDTTAAAYEAAADALERLV